MFRGRRNAGRRLIVICPFGAIVSKIDGFTLGCGNALLLAHSLNHPCLQQAVAVLRVLTGLVPVKAACHAGAHKTAVIALSIAGIFEGFSCGLRTTPIREG